MATCFFGGKAIGVIEEKSETNPVGIEVKKRLKDFQKRKMPENA